MPQGFEAVDKLIHVGMYADLMFLLFHAGVSQMEIESNFLARQMLASILEILINAIVDELTQTNFGRKFQVADVVANILAIVAGQGACLVKFVQNESESVE